MVSSANAPSSWMSNMKKDKRAKLVDKAIRLVWASLDTHLDYTHKEHHDSANFHKKCVREYAGLIKILSELY